MMYLGITGLLLKTTQANIFKHLCTLYKYMKLLWSSDPNVCFNEQGYELGSLLINKIFFLG